MTTQSRRSERPEGSVTAWIELHQAVWTHRKTFELAAVLGLDETYAAAHVIRLWSWTLDNAPDGDLSHLSARAIAYGAGWRTGAAEVFVRALVTVGWLDADQRIHDWDEYAGRLVDRREANRERMRRARAHSVRDTSGARAGATGPDLTGPNHTGPLPPTPSRTAGRDAAAPRRTQTRQKSSEPEPPYVGSLTPEEIEEWTQPRRFLPPQP